MGAFFCDTCWFRKTTEGPETHNTFMDDLNEGDCIIKKRPCRCHWENYDIFTRCCTTFRDFYKLGSAKSREETPDLIDDPLNKDQFMMF